MGHVGNDASTPPGDGKSPIALFRQLGPGLITGAADDDPSGIATYSQAGAQFGFGLLWTMLLTYPLMCAVQLMSAEVGRVTGCGLAMSMRKVMPRAVVLLLVALLFVANTINIGADIAAMGAATRLVIGGSEKLYVVGFALVSVCPAALPALSALRKSPEVADARAAELRGARLHAAHRLGGRC